MIVLYTDFGDKGPYLGQMKGVLAQEAPAIAVVDLMADAPAFNAKASAYLLASVSQPFPPGSVFLCVVDPGVGTPRRPLVANIDDRWFVGPDNGLLGLVARRGDSVRWGEICWRPGQLSASFHGRDLFAPVAARLATGRGVDVEWIDAPLSADDWPDDLLEVIYVDGYGNCMTGLRSGCVAHSSTLEFSGRLLSYSRTFAEAESGQPFWYENSMGLIEISINQGSAAQQLGLSVGDKINFLS